MAITQTVVGFKKQDAGDANWDVGLDDGFDDATTRLTLTQAGTPDLLVAGDWVGQFCWDITNKKAYFCTLIGAIGVARWQELESLLLAGTLDVTGVSTLVGLVNATAGVQKTGAAPLDLPEGLKLPTGKTIEVFSGENSFTDGAVAFQLHAHAARHAKGGADPLLGNVIQQIKLGTDIGSPAWTASAQSFMEMTLDFASRSGTSHGLFFLRARDACAIFAHTMSLYLTKTLDGAEATALGTGEPNDGIVFSITVGTVPSDGMMLWFHETGIPNTDGQKYYLNGKQQVTCAGAVTNRGFMFIDLGEE